MRLSRNGLIILDSAIITVNIDIVQEIQIYSNEQELVFNI